MNSIWKIYIFIIIYGCLPPLTSISNDQLKFDSLLSELNIVKDQKLKVDILNNLANDFSSFDIEKAFQYAKRADSIAKEINDKEGRAESNYNIGNIYYNKSFFKQAISHYNKAYRLYQNSNDTNGIAQTLCKMAITYTLTGNNTKALEHQLNSLKYSSPIDAKTLMARSYNHIGIIHLEMKEYDKALEFHALSQQISEELNNVKGKLRSLNNIGIVYKHIGDYENAIKYYNQAIESAKSTGNKKFAASALGNLAVIYQVQEKLNKALEKHFEALEIKQEIGNKRGIAITLYNIGEVYFRSKQYNKALNYLLRSTTLANKMDDKTRLAENAKLISEIYAKQNDYNQAYYFFKKYAQLKDTLYNEKSTKKLLELQAQYETGKKEKEIALLKKEQQYQKLKNNRIRVLIFSLIGGIVLLFFVLSIIYRAFRQKKKANQLLRDKNQEIEQQKEEIESQRNNLEELYFELSKKKEEIEGQRNEIEDKNKYITESIIYAQLIQQAVLISPKILKSIFSNSFLLLIPKDIVSGDFFWVYRKKEKIYFAAIDCTGHGVPGAFMSVVSHNLLNQTMNDNDYTKPSDILDHLNRTINSTLHFNYDDNRSSLVRDGMDMALCSYDPASNILEYAGAFCPLYHIHNGDLVRYKADIQPIEVSTKKSYIPFTNHTIHIQKNDIIYLFSDGITDQFGGADRRKFSQTKLRNLLLGIHKDPLDKQKEKIANTFNNWKKDIPQVDDVLVVGIKFK